MKLSIAMPVYNEVRTIQKIIATVFESPLPQGIEKELVIVDDCSTDGTRELLQAIRADGLKIFYHEKNRGKGAALRTAFSHCSGDIILIQDADLEYDPNEYPKLLNPIINGNADVVFGSRFIGGEEHRVLYFWHAIANKLLTLLSNMLSNLTLTDMETCYKVFRRAVMQKITIEENRFGVEPEVTAKIAALARQENISIYEVGISYHGRTYDEGKKIGLKDAVRALWCVLKYNTSKLANFIKYALSGLFVALSQFATMIFFVELLQFKTTLLQNAAYAISIEASILLGFFLHAFITWRYRFHSAGQFLLKLLTFQIVTAVSFLIRQALFYILLQAGIDYRVNTLIGIAVAIILNFFGYQNIVFKHRGPPRN